MSARGSRRISHTCKRNWGQTIELISVTLDPKRDRPDTLSEYAAALGSGYAHWHFLTGTETDIRDSGKPVWRSLLGRRRGPDTLVCSCYDWPRRARSRGQLDGSAYSVKSLRISSRCSWREAGSGSERRKRGAWLVSEMHRWWQQHHAGRTWFGPLSVGLRAR